MTRRTITVLAAAILSAGAVAHAAPRADVAPASVAERLPVKPGGPIAVEYRLAAQPLVGTPLEIAITARVEAGVTDLAIEANPSAPRAVLLTPVEVVARGDGVYSWNITVVPLATEAGYLTVLVSGQAEGLTQSRSVTVPLGSAAPAGATPAPEAAEGEALIALPVQEGP